MPSAKRALFYQPNCGLSGDMHLAALVDLGVPENLLRSSLAGLPLGEAFQLELRAAQKMGISGTYANVRAQDQHEHRHHSTIANMIREAGLPASVEKLALNIFQSIAVAEGKIHNIAPEKVHFHEVGAVDSIVDIVAAAICIDYFQPEVILCGPIEVGSGYVDCAHGRFPVPAPATQELLASAPCTYGTVTGEATTPTGAAIMAVAVDEFQPKGVFTPERIGYGIGHKDFEIPNVLRVALGSYQVPAETATDKLPSVHADSVQDAYKIEANIDDMSPEAYEPLMQALYAAGAVDVYLTPIIMKKGRPAHCLAALCAAEHRDQIANEILNRSTTIGLRIIPFEKRILPRELQRITTSLGEVTIKMVTQPNGERRWKSEHDDIVALAQQHELDYQTAKTRIDFEIEQSMQEP